MNFGLITDIQFADIEDKLIRSSKWRRYRRSLTCLSDAVTHWNSSQQNITFAIQLGDIIDGFNVNRKASKSALQSVLREFQQLHDDIGVFHVLGNHELYNFTRNELTETALNPAHFTACGKSISCRVVVDKFYYSFEVEQCKNFQFIVLDAFDVSILGRDANTMEYKRALEILLKHNRNEDLESIDGLEGIEKRFVAYNGGISSDQLEWLTRLLINADNNNQKVIIFSHIPLHPGCTTDKSDGVDVVWNYEEVLNVIWNHRCVTVCLYGHMHEYGYCRDKEGIHHRVLEAVVEADLTKNAFTTVRVLKDKLVIDGQGDIRSQVLNFR